MLLAEHELHPAVAETLAAYSDGKTPANGLRIPDYQRWSIVLDRLDGGDLLDIGIGMGQFPDAAMRSGKFSRVRGADRKPHSAYRNLSGFEFVACDLTNDPGSLSAEVVTCLECIEHIHSPEFGKAVANLKKIARRRLIVTVPFEENPVAKYHFQYFDMERLESLFPGADIQVLRKPTGSAWALVDVQTHIEASASSASQERVRVTPTGEEFDTEHFLSENPLGLDLGELVEIGLALEDGRGVTLEDGRTVSPAR